MFCQVYLIFGEISVSSRNSTGFSTIGISYFLNLVYRQLGDSNSQWHKKILQKVPVGGSASLGKCQFGDKGQFGDKI